MFRVSYLILTFAGLSPEARDGIIAAAVLGSILVAAILAVVIGVLYCCHPCRSNQSEGAYTYMYRQTETFICSCFLYLSSLL